MRGPLGLDLHPQECKPLLVSPGAANGSSGVTDLTLFSIRNRYEMFREKADGSWHR